MILKFNKLVEVVKIHVYVKFHRAKCSNSSVSVHRENKTERPCGKQYGRRFRGQWKVGQRCRRFAAGDNNVARKTAELIVSVYESVRFTPLHTVSHKTIRSAILTRQHRTPFIRRETFGGHIVATCYCYRDTNILFNGHNHRNAIYESGQCPYQTHV